jgi:hypothetical protein
MVHHIAARKRIGGSKEFSFAIPKRLLEQYLPTTEFFLRKAAVTKGFRNASPLVLGTEQRPSRSRRKFLGGSATSASLPWNSSSGGVSGSENFE